MQLLSDHNEWLQIKLEDLKVLRCSPDLFNNVNIGQGQLRIIIWTNLEGPTSPIVHTKSQYYRPSGSGEKEV